MEIGIIGACTVQKEAKPTHSVEVTQLNLHHRTTCTCLDGRKSLLQF
jgi:hypothetical protein